MPFASINPTIPRTNPENFGGNCPPFGKVENLSFFELAILNFFPKKIYFASFLFKSVTIYGIPWIGQNFEDYPGFKQKARGIQNNEKHCRSVQHK